MIYKHWKKAALALTALFWASCEETSTSATSISLEQGNSSSSTEDPSTSSSSTENTGSQTETSSTNTEIESSSTENGGSSTTASSSSTENGISSANVPESSSSDDLDMQVMPLYGIITPQIIVSSASSNNTSKAPCFEDVAQRTANEQTSTTQSVLKCYDGATCIETTTERMQGLPCSSTGDGLEVMCPDYGIIAISEKTYLCDDGQTYNEAEFKTHYYKDKAPYKKIPCHFAGEGTLECDDGETYSVSEKDGQIVYSNERFDYSKKEFDIKYSTTDESMVALYGPPCVFNGTCDEENN